MVTKQEYAVLAATAYNDLRGTGNRVEILPPGWAQIADQSSTGGPLESGLSIKAFQKGNEIVIACKGTDFLFGTNTGQSVSDIIADLGLGTSIGLASTQIFQAAKFYLEVKALHPEATFSFTGHSLGAGLASVLGAWFDQSTTVFANAPFEATALNPIVMGYVGGYLALNGLGDSSFADFLLTYPVTYGGREANVTNHYVQGELLKHFLSWAPFVEGTQAQINVSSAGVPPDTLHSIVLHAALTLSEQFRLDTFLAPTLLARIFDSTLYARKPELAAEDFLIKMLKLQVANGGDLQSGRITQFAQDISKLAGMSVTTQDALISQCVEWNFFRSDVAAAPFFQQSGDLLQYTIALGAGFENAQNKAADYVKAWLQPIVQQNNGSYLSSFSAIDQWNVATSSSAVNGSAQDATKSQVFIGNMGSDTFTAGSANDLLLGGVGTDTLKGGDGHDILFG